MLRIKTKLQAPSFNMRGYQAELERLAREIMSLAMFEYVVTATEIIPVWSGASHATFTELAQLAGLPLVITPSPTADYDGQSYGAQQGDALLDIDTARGQFTFIYQTDLPHLVYNESQNANQNPDPGLRWKLKKPGPYNFQKQAGGRVKKVLQTFRGPSINKYIRVRRVR